MATNQVRMITTAEIELLSFLRQNIIRKLLEEVATQNRDKRDLQVIAAVVAYFNLGPAPHGLFHNLVHQLAHSFQVSFMVLNSCHPTELALLNGAQRATEIKAARGSIYQKYVHTSFIVKINFKFGSFKLFEFVRVKDNVGGRNLSSMNF